MKNIFLAQLAFVLCSPTYAAHAQGTAPTYQGRPCTRAKGGKVTVHGPPNESRTTRKQAAR